MSLPVFPRTQIESSGKALSLLRIGCRAQSLDERLGSAVLCSGGDSPLLDSWQDQLLAPWLKAFAGGSREALERRLEWSGANIEAAARAFLPRESGEIPSWTVELEAYCRQVARRNEVVETCPAERDALRTSNDLPFVELWCPWLAVARAGLPETVLRALGEGFLPEAVRDLERLLLKGIAEFSALATFQTYGENGGMGYSAWIQRVLEDPLGELYESFPALARRTAERVEQWRGLIGDLVSRWQADRPSVLRQLGASGAGMVRSVLGGLSDRHQNGREVLCLELESGFKVLFKPRCVRVEQAFFAWLDWCREQGLKEVPGAPRVVAGDGYGWIEWIAQEPARTTAEARGFYRSAGVLLAIAHVLRARDLHAENLVATRSGPVVVDAEVLLQPCWSSWESDSGATGSRPANADCLETGLLLEPGLGDEKEEREWGGLRPSLMRSSSIGSVLKWTALNQDGMQLEVVKAPERRLENVLWLRGEALGPHSFPEELSRGFRRAYRFFLRQRESILDPGGPLALFEACRVRYLLRPSQEYAKLLTLLAMPRNQRSGLAGSLLYEALISGLSSHDCRPLLWPLNIEEREALLRGDLPRFSIPATATALETEDGRPIERALDLSGLAAVRELFAGLGAADLKRQERSIELALGPPLKWDLGLPSEKGATKSSLAASAAKRPEAQDSASFRLIFRDVACRLGRHLSARELPAIESGSDELSLGSGPIGTALFLAALARIEGGKALQRTLRRLLDRNEESLARARGKRFHRVPNPGGFEGEGSLIVALAWLGELLQDRASWQMAEAWIDEFHRSPIEEDCKYDLLGGTAGLLMASLTYFGMTGSIRASELASRCGEHLLSRQVVMPRGSAWRNRGGVALLGWAHGAAGIARALFALSGHEESVGREGKRFAAAAAEAVGYEDSHFDATRANWPVLFRGKEGTFERGWMNTWCHGAPGIVLSRIYLPRGASREEQIRTSAVVSTLAEARSSSVDHLCCGNLGRSAVARHIAQLSNQPVWLDQAEQAALAVVERAQSRGRFHLRADRLASRDSFGGFLKGLAGIGYYLLKFGGFDDLPELLALELPGERAIRRLRVKGEIYEFAHEEGRDSAAP